MLRLSNSVITIGVTLIVLLITAGGATAQRPVVAQLLNTHGTVTIRYGAKSVKGQTGTSLRPGDTVVIDPSSRTHVWFPALGARFALTSATKVIVQSNNLQSKSGSPPQKLPVIGGMLTVSVEKDTVLAATVVRGASLFDLLPIGAIDSTTPTLRWKRRSPGPTTLVIRDTHKVVLRQELTADATEYNIPANTLRPGVWYAWSILVKTSDDVEVGSSWIRVASPADTTSQEATTRAANILRRADPEDPTPDILLARLYWNLGRLEEAERFCKSALDQSPHDTEMQELHDRLKAMTW